MTSLLHPPHPPEPQNTTQLLSVLGLKETLHPSSQGLLRNLRRETWSSRNSVPVGTFSFPEGSLPFSSLPLSLSVPSPVSLEQREGQLFQE